MQDKFIQQLKEFVQQQNIEFQSDDDYQQEIKSFIPQIFQQNFLKFNTMLQSLGCKKSELININNNIKKKQFFKIAAQEYKKNKTNVINPFQSNQLYQNEKQKLKELEVDQNQINFQCCQKKLYECLILGILIKYKDIFNQEEYKTKFNQINKIKLYELVLQLQNYLIQEKRLSFQIKNAIQKIRSDADIHTQLFIIKKQLHPIDINDLSRLIQKTNHAKKQIQNKSVILFMGDTGSGKTTTILSFLGHKMIKTKFKGMDWITTLQQLTPNEKCLRSSPQQKSITRYIFAIKPKQTYSQDIYFCDSPGFGDSAGPEVDLANGIGMIQAIRYSKCIRPVIIIGVQGWGNRGKGMKDLVRLLGKIFPNYDDIKQSVTYIFTKFPEGQLQNLNSKITDLIQKLDPIQRDNQNFVKILIDIKENTQDFQEIISFDPLQQNQYKKILRKILKKKKFNNTSQLSMDFKQDTTLLIQNQCAILTNRIEYYLQKQNIYGIKYFLNLLKKFSILLQSRPIINQYQNNRNKIVQKIKEKFEKIKDQFSLRINNINLTQQDINNYQNSLKEQKKFQEFLQNKKSLQQRLSYECKKLLEKLNARNEGKQYEIISIIKLINHKFKPSQFKNLSKQLKQKIEQYKYLYKYNLTQFKIAQSLQNYKQAIMFIKLLCKFEGEDKISIKLQQKLYQIEQILPNFIETQQKKKQYQLNTISEENCKKVSNLYSFFIQIKNNYQLIKLHRESICNIILQKIKTFTNCIIQKAKQKTKVINQKLNQFKKQSIKDQGVSQIIKNISNLNNMFLIPFIADQLTDKLEYFYQNLNHYIQSQQNNLIQLCEAIKNQDSSIKLKKGLRQLQKSLQAIEKLSKFVSQDFQNKGRQIIMKTMNILNNHLSQTQQQIKSIQINFKNSKLEINIEKLFKIMDQMEYFKEIKSNGMGIELIKNINEKGKQKFKKVLNEISIIRQNFKKSSSPQDKISSYKDVSFNLIQKSLVFLIKSNLLVKDIQLKKLISDNLLQFDIELKKYQHQSIELIKKNMVQIKKIMKPENKHELISITKKKIQQILYLNKNFKNTIEITFDDQYDQKFNRQLKSYCKNIYFDYQKQWKQLKNTNLYERINNLSQNCQFFVMVLKQFEQQLYKQFLNLRQETIKYVINKQNSIQLKIKQIITKQRYQLLQAQLDKLKQNQTQTNKLILESLIIQINQNILDILKNVKRIKTQLQFEAEEGQNLKIEIFDQLLKLSQIQKYLKNYPTQDIKNKIKSTIKDLNLFIEESLRMKIQKIETKIESNKLEEAFKQCNELKKIQIIILQTQAERSSKLLQEIKITECSNHNQLLSKLHTKRQQIQKKYKDREQIEFNYEQLKKYNTFFSKDITIKFLRNTQIIVDHSIISYFKFEFQNYVASKSSIVQQQKQKEIQRKIQYIPEHLKGDILKEYQQKKKIKESSKQEVNKHIEAMLKTNYSHENIIKIIKEYDSKKNYFLVQKCRQFIQLQFKDEFKQIETNMKLIIMLQKYNTNFYENYRKYEIQKLQEIVKPLYKKYQNKFKSVLDEQYNQKFNLGDFFNVGGSQSQIEQQQMNNSLYNIKDSSSQKIKLKLIQLYEAIKFIESNEKILLDYGKKFVVEAHKLSDKIRQIYEKLVKYFDDFFSKQNVESSKQINLKLYQLRKLEQSYKFLSTKNEFKENTKLVNKQIQYKWILKKFQQKFQEKLKSSSNFNINNNVSNEQLQQHIQKINKDLRFIKCFESNYKKILRNSINNQQQKSIYEGKIYNILELMENKYQAKIKQVLNQKNKIEQIEDTLNVNWQYLNIFCTKFIEKQKIKFLQKFLSLIQNKIKDQSILINSKFQKLKIQCKQKQTVSVSKVSSEIFNIPMVIVQFMIKLKIFINIIKSSQIKDIFDQILHKCQELTDQGTEMIIRQIQEKEGLCKGAQDLKFTNFYKKYKKTQKASKKIRQFKSILKQLIIQQDNNNKQQFKQLQSYHNKFLNKYNKYINCQSEYIPIIYQQVNRLKKQINKEISKHKQESIQLLACLMILWSFIYSKRGSQNKIINQYIPYSSQILTLILFITGKSARKQLIQIKKGSGKSLVIIILANFMAILGFNVNVACRNKYSMKYNQNFSKKFSEKLNVNSLICFDTLINHCKKIFSYDSQQRKKELFQNLKKQQQSKHNQVSIRINEENMKNTFLLIDEIDEIFQDRFLYDSYIPIYEQKEKMGQIFSTVLHTQNNQQAIQQFLNKENVNKLIHQSQLYKWKFLQLLMSHHYNQYSQLPNESFEEKINYGYKTQLQYIKNGNKPTGYIPHISIKLGNYMYYTLLMHFENIYYFTNFYQSFTAQQKQILKKCLKIDRVVLIPAQFELVRQVSQKICLTNLKDHQQKIVEKTKSLVQANRSVIIIIQNNNKLKNLQRQISTLKLNYSTCVQLDLSAIQRAIYNISKVKKVLIINFNIFQKIRLRLNQQLEKFGGYHIIQTFIFDSYIQNKMLTTRIINQNMRGSYEIIINDNQVKLFEMNPKQDLVSSYNMIMQQSLTKKLKLIQKIFIKNQNQIKKKKQYKLLKGTYNFQKKFLTSSHYYQISLQKSYLKNHNFFTRYHKYLRLIIAFDASSLSLIKIMQQNFRKLIDETKNFILIQIAFIKNSQILYSPYQSTPENLIKFLRIIKLYQIEQKFDQKKLKEYFNQENNRESKILLFLNSKPIDKQKQHQEQLKNRIQAFNWGNNAQIHDYLHSFSNSLRKSVNLLNFQIVKEFLQNKIENAINQFLKQATRLHQKSTIENLTIY